MKHLSVSGHGYITLSNLHSYLFHDSSNLMKVPILLRSLMKPLHTLLISIRIYWCEWSVWMSSVLSELVGSRVLVRLWSRTGFLEEQQLVDGKRWTGTAAVCRRLWRVWSRDEECRGEGSWSQEIQHRENVASSTKEEMWSLVTTGPDGLPQEGKRREGLERNEPDRHEERKQ